MNLSGKTALVTGAGSGIGRAAALKLAADGARLALLDVSQDSLESVATEIGGDTLKLRADVADESEMGSAFAEIAKTFGRLDFVFANAGINGIWAPLDELTYAEWNQTQSINLGGTFLTLRNAVPLMKQRGGSIVVTSSINGTRTFSTAGASAYSTSKAGQFALALMAALELAQYRIRVNVICPGQTTTRIGERTTLRNTHRAKVAVEFPNGSIPLTGGEPATAEDIADLVAFLASDASRHISGTPIWIDGAQSLLI